MKKICLVYPECYEVERFGNKRKELPPFGVMYLAGALEKENYDVKIIATSNDNNSFDFSDFDIVGFSISSSLAYPLIKETRKNSIFKANSLIIAGGIHASLYPREVICELNCDIVSIGEGEKTIVEIAKASSLDDFAKIKGIYYKKDNSIYVTEKRNDINDLDTLAFPARHLLPKEDIVMKRLADTSLPIAHVLFSRGCPYHCNFCANQNHNIRYRGKENIKEELELLIKDYGIKGFCVFDDNFLVNKEKAMEIIREIGKLDLKWSTLARVDNVDLELLRELKNSGCIRIKYGVESGSQKMLDLMKKNITVDEIKKAFKLTKEVGIDTKALIMHGFPGEDFNTTKETIALLEELKMCISRIGLTYFTYLPGSPIYPSEHITCNTSVYCEDQVPWGSDKEKEEVLESRKLLVKYIKKNFPNK